jgi:DUF1009 family protein
VSVSRGGAPVGLIAGNGVLPRLLADAARAQGRRVVALAHRGETDGSLADRVDALEWVRLGQLDRIVRLLRQHGVREAVLAGGIHRVRAFSEVRPDVGALQVIARLRTVRDDALLRAVADYLEGKGIRVIAPTDFAPEVLAPEGPLVGEEPDAAAQRDIALGIEVATQLGRADVGQTVVVKNGHVLALEAVEGTDETLRRGGRLGGLALLRGRGGSGDPVPGLSVALGRAPGPLTQAPYVARLREVERRKDRQPDDGREAGVRPDLLQRDRRDGQEHMHVTGRP